MDSDPRTVVLSRNSSTNCLDILLMAVQGSITARIWCFFLPITTSIIAVGNSKVAFGVAIDAIVSDRWLVELVFGGSPAGLFSTFTVLVFLLRNFGLSICNKE